MTRETIDFGIDLGTTNSAIAVLRDGAPQPLRNNEQSEITPSAVMVDKSGTVTVGQSAYRRAELYPDRVAREFKRAMGTESTISLSGQVWTAEQLSAEVLKALCADARNTLGEEVWSAVITVPAMFTLAASDATARAAKVAGIEQVPLLQEPIAAGIAYGVQSSDADGYWVVYDLGGGTFDASLMTLRQGRLKVVDHAGDEYLGGKNLDEALLDYAVDQLRSQYEIQGPVRRDARHGRLYALLKARCEEARIYLSRQEQTVIELGQVQDDAGEPIDTEIPISRSILERLIEPSVTHSIDMVRRLLERNSLSPSGVRRVLMVGGPTFTPYIRMRVQRDLDIDLETRTDPMTVVARGAAIYAGTVLRERKNVAPVTAQSDVRLDLKYAPVSEQTEALVGGRVQDGTTDGLLIEVNRADGGWGSGRLPVSNGTFITTVLLRSSQANVFQIRALDSTGHELRVEPDKFVISHGLVVDEPPLSRSVGVAVDDGSGEPKTRWLIEHGARLPARGQHIFHTIRPVAPGQPVGINLHVVEGHAPRANRNDHVGYIRLSGEGLKRSLPIGAEVDIRMEVDASRRLTVNAFVPLLDETLTLAVADVNRPRPDLEVLRMGVSAELDRIERLTSVARVEDRTRNELGDVSVLLESAMGGDDDAAMSAQRRLHDVQTALDEVEELAQVSLAEAEWREALPKTRQLLGQYGDQSSRQRMLVLEREGEDARSTQNLPLLRRRLEQVQQLYWNTLLNQDGWWIGFYQDLVERQNEVVDPATARLLIQEGRRALDRQDFEALRQACRRLWDLFPQAQSSGGLPDVGIRA